MEKAIHHSIELTPYAESLLLGSPNSPETFLQYRNKRKSWTLWSFMSYGQTWNTCTEKGMNNHIKAHFLREQIYGSVSFPRYDAEIAFVRGFSLNDMGETIMDKLRKEDPVFDEHKISEGHLGRKILTERYHNRILQALFLFRGLGLVDVDFDEIKSLYPKLEGVVAHISKESSNSAVEFTTYFSSLPVLTKRNVEGVGDTMRELGDTLAHLEGERRRK